MHACGNYIKHINAFNIGVIKEDEKANADKSSDEYNNLVVFLSEMCDIISQYKKFKEQTFADLRECLNEAYNAVQNREYYRSYLIQKLGYEKSKDPIFLFKTGEAQNLIGHVNEARRNIEEAFSQDPELLKRANINFLYGKHKFKNKIVDKCPICGSPGVLYSCY